jgi:hypothetical protein
MTDLKQHAEKLKALHDAGLRRQPAEPTTMHQLAGVGLALEGGRFASETTVTGAEPAMHYPKLPEGSPWAGGGDVGLQPPTGININEQEPTGTPAEVAASIAQLANSETAEIASSPGLAGDAIASIRVGLPTPEGSPVPSARVGPAAAPSLLIPPTVSAAARPTRQSCRRC